MTFSLGSKQGHCFTTSQQPLRRENASKNIADENLKKQTGQPKQKKHKSPSQRLRDRKRAYNFQKKKQLVPNLLLPFTGKVVPLKNNRETEPAEPYVNIDEVMETPTSTVVSNNPIFPLKGHASKVEHLNLGNEKVIEARKKLFATDNIVGPTSFLEKKKTLPSHVPAYAKRESELWSTLFD